jgi:hypothetical protein
MVENSSINIKVRIANFDDKLQVFALMNDNAKEVGNFDKEKFEYAGE